MTTLALICALAAATPAGAAARPLKTGVSYVYDSSPVAFEHVKRAGASLVLTPLRWETVAPSSEPAAWQPTDPADPHYDWEAIDPWVTNAVAAGLTPVLQVRGAPLWAQRCPGASETDAPCDADPAALAAFATAAATRYSGRFGGLPHVQYWQGLNEPNLSLFFTPQFEGGKAVSAGLYRTLINSFYYAIKAVDPSNLVLTGGLGPISVPKYTIGPMRFTRELLCMRGKERFRPAPGDCEGGVHFDIFDIHPYTTGGPTHEGGANDVEMGDLGKLQRLLRAADRAGRTKGRFKHTPLWVTELSWDSNPPDPGGLPMKIETRWTAEALFRAWRAGVDTFFWFSLRDSPTGSFPFSETQQSGLYFSGPNIEQDQPKENLYSFRFPFVAYPGRKGIYLWGRTPTSSSGKVSIQVWRGKRWHHVLTVRANESGIFRGLAPSRYGQSRKGSVRARFGSESSVPFSMRPVPDFYQPPFG